MSPGRLTEEHQKLNEDADQRLAACACITNSDQNKYGSAIKNLNIQKYLKNDQHPTTIADAHNALSNHVHENVQRKKLRLKRLRKKLKH